MIRRLLLVLGLVAAIVGLGAIGASAQNTSLANHPFVGAWMVSTPGGPALTVNYPDGTSVSAFTASSATPDGVTFQSTQVGVWEPTGARTAHVTGTFLYSDAKGAFTGSFTYDGFQSVSEDGQTVVSDDGGTATVRDADNNVVASFPAGVGVTVGTRMQVGSQPAFPARSPAAASPTP